MLVIAPSIGQRFRCRGTAGSRLGYFFFSKGRILFLGTRWMDISFGQSVGQGASFGPVTSACARGRHVVSLYSQEAAATGPYDPLVNNDRAGSGDE